MAARIIDGKAVSERRRGALAQRVAGLGGRGISPCLAAITVREDHGWTVYARNQAAACAQVGISYRTVALPAGAGPEDLAEAIEALNVDAAVHGIILQAPLPEGFDPFQAQARISPDKDVEGVNPANLGLVLAGRPALAPCTALSAFALAQEALPDLKGVEAVVVGASTIVGKPVAQLLLAAGATVAVCHILTRDLALHTRRAELLVVAAGKAGLIRSEHVRPGAVVVDVGINRRTGPDGKVQTVGDVDPAVAEVAGALTPVPGGVGAMTTTILLESTVDAAERLAAAVGAIDGAAIARLLGGLELPAGAADRVATLLARHLVGLPAAGAVRAPLERRLAAISGGGGALLLDGAMGTELIARGIPCERVLAANRDQPESVLAVHRAYREAGARVLTANTFGANRYRSGAEAAILATLGVRLARQAGGGEALVLGCLGPLGLVVGADLDAAEAENAFAEVAQAMADALVDGFILETMGSTREAAAALAACRRVSRLPVIACRHVERADATELAEFAAAMEAGGAAAVGLNCGAGPRLMLPAVRLLAAATRLPVAARPNAGHPTHADGAFRYHLRPAWLVEQAEAMLAAGVGIIGGCCGVGPAHIRSLQILAGRTLGPRPATVPATAAPLPGAPHPLLAAFAAGQFPVFAWMPGRQAGSDDAGLGRLAAAGANAVGLLAGWPGASRGHRLAARLRHAQDAAARPAVLDLIAGECPLREAEERLLAAHLLGLRTVVVDAGVFGGTADPLTMLRLVTALNAGRSLAGARLEEATAFALGVRVRADDQRLAEYATAGANFVCLQPVYEAARFRTFVEAYRLDLPLVADVLLLPDAATAAELDNELPVLAVPERLKERLARDPDEDLRGVQRFLDRWRGRLSGIGVLTADGRTAQAEALIRTVKMAV